MDLRLNSTVVEGMTLPPETAISRLPTDARFTPAMHAELARNDRRKLRCERVCFPQSSLRPESSPVFNRNLSPLRLEARPNNSSPRHLLLCHRGYQTGIPTYPASGWAVAVSQKKTLNRVMRF